VTQIVHEHPTLSPLTGTQLDDPPHIEWTLERLIEACRIKGIRFDETHNLTSLQGFAVSCGRTVLINVRANLPREEKLFTLAHELGHIALGRMYTTTVGEVLDWLDTSLAAFQDAAQETSADLWAAHLLVPPELFAAHYAAAKERMATSPEEDILASAMRQTARSLGVLPHVVEIWYAHRDECPVPAPASWLNGV